MKCFLFVIAVATALFSGGGVSTTTHAITIKPSKAIATVVKVVPDIFNRPIPELEFKDAMTSSCSSAREHGKSIRLSATVIRKVKALENILPLSDPTGHDMITTVITKTTSMHRDYSRDINGKRQLVTTPTSIIFMNNNPDAYLSLDEEGMSIPIIKGSLVKFDGSKLHHTIINDGIVQLVGPFEGNRLSPVGVCETYGNPGEYCNYDEYKCCETGLSCQNRIDIMSLNKICLCESPRISLNNECIDYGSFPSVSCCETGLVCQGRRRLEDSIEGHDVERKLQIGVCVAAPTNSPTNAPTVGPSLNPTKFPTKNPTPAPTDTPTEFPTKNPTDAPTDTPTDVPSDGPTKIPTDSPETTDPSKAPTDAPVKAATAVPTDAPVKAATAVPTDAPVKAATAVPTMSSSGSDVTEAPSAVGKDKKEVIFELFLIHLTLLLKKGKTITIHDLWSDKFYNLEYFLNYLHKAHPKLEGTDDDDLEGMKIKLMELLEEETGGHGRALLERIHADMDKATAHGGLRNAAAAHDNGIDMEGMKAKIMDVLDKMDE